MNLNVEVGDELGALLQARAQAQGVSPGRIVSQVLEDTFAGEIHHAEGQTPAVRHVWEVIADNMADVPLEEFAKLPQDGASQVDHYLYGHPKR
jgi:hypothetical protein